MSMPAVQRLRERFPSSHIALLVKEPLLDLWSNNPFLTEIIPHSQLASLRRKAFDLALLFPNSFRAAWEAYRAEIPRRLGYAGHWRRLLLTDVIPGNWKRLTASHLIQHYLAFSHYLGGSDEIVPPR